MIVALQVVWYNHVKIQQARIHHSLQTNLAVHASTKNCFAILFVKGLTPECAGFPVGMLTDRFENLA